LGIRKGAFKTLSYSKSQLGLTCTTQSSNATDCRLTEDMHEMINLALPANKVGNRGAKLVQALDGMSVRYVFCPCDIIANDYIVLA
jgi:hypothetical protein